MQDVCAYPYIEGAELAERAHRVVLDLSLGSLVRLGMYFQAFSMVLNLSPACV